MQLFPAIDLRGGQVVRLTQGDYDRMTVYGQDPCAQARSFVAAGAKNLHVVDLDGAKDGTLSNYDTIAALAKQGGLYIEVGGGIRTEERIEKYLSLGVGRCILGSGKIHPRPYFRLKSPNSLSKAALSANKCSPSVMDSPLLAPIKIASASLNFSAIGFQSIIFVRPFLFYGCCAGALLPEGS